MKSLIAALSLVAVSIAFTSASFAADKPEKPKDHAFTGVIVSVDATACNVVVKNKKDDSKTFTVNDKTKYATVDKKDATLADLKAGDKVMVQFVEEGDKLIAKKIGPPAAGKKKEEKK